MEIRENEIIALGYGKYCRSDRIVGIEPIEKERGPARRTYVYIEGRPEPMVASRTEEAILRDLVVSQEGAEASVVMDLLDEVLHDMEKVGPMLRRSIREEAGLDIDELISKIRRKISGKRISRLDQGALF